ncbi:hypothetical protein FGO68_gene14292 [Halteria grandinella]|uniref:Uncharacterized protein n=1 Tax=Halteria grandinella TaxID=5974 RepID=A0A8J8SXR3_HALGN|nr:hypothetical protein FGO68_gene14292 [Halteria grandinella]
MQQDNQISCLKQKKMKLDNSQFKEEVKSNRPQTQSTKNAKTMIDNVQNSLEAVQVAFGSSGLQNVLGSSAINSSADNDLYQEANKAKKGKKMADDIDEDPFDPASLKKQSIVEPVDVNCKQEEDEIENNERYFDFTNESNEKELLKQFQRFERHGVSESELLGMQSSMYQDEKQDQKCLNESIAVSREACRSLRLEGCMSSCRSTYSRQTMCCCLIPSSATPYTTFSSSLSSFRCISLQIMAGMQKMGSKNQSNRPLMWMAIYLNYFLKEVATYLIEHKKHNHQRSFSSWRKPQKSKTPSGGWMSKSNLLTLPSIFCLQGIKMSI